MTYIILRPAFKDFWKKLKWTNADITLKVFLRPWFHVSVYIWIHKGFFVNSPSIRMYPVPQPNLRRFESTLRLKLLNTIWIGYHVTWNAFESVYFWIGWRNKIGSSRQCTSIQHGSQNKCYRFFSHCTYFKSDGVFLVKFVYVLSSPKLCEKTTWHSEASFNVWWSNFTPQTTEMSWKTYRSSTILGLAKRNKCLVGLVCKPDSERGRMAREFLHESCFFV